MSVTGWWPWVSRARLEDALEQIAWLRDELASRQESDTRIARVKAGLTEVPAKPREKLDPMPTKLIAYINSIGNPSIRRQARQTAFKRRLKESWADIVDDVLTPRPDEVIMRPEDIPDE